MANLTAPQAAELATILRLLDVGEKPTLPQGVVRRIVRFLRSVVGADILPHRRDEEGFDEQPIRTLLRVLQILADAWEGEPCPECPTLGPVFSNAYVYETSYVDPTFNYELYQGYEGSTDDPAGATKIHVQLQSRPLAGAYDWNAVTEEWYVTIGAVSLHTVGSMTCGATDKLRFRYRFVDAGNLPLSEWSYTDEFDTDTYAA